MSVKTVGVRFNSAGQVYHYLTNLEGLLTGQKVIVDSPSDGYVTVTIVSIQDGAQGKATKYIVNTIDDTDYKARAEKERLRKQIVARLEEKKKEVEQMAVYKYLSENDSEAALLFEQLKALS